MAFIVKEKPFSKKWLINYGLIIIGTFILAAGFVFFITPYMIVPGGVYGISIVIHYLTKGILSFAPDGFPVGLMGLILNIPLTILGIKMVYPLHYPSKNVDMQINSGMYRVYKCCPGGFSCSELFAAKADKIFALK